MIILWSESLLVAVQSGKGHICFTKPCPLKMGCEISGWRFFYARFTVARNRFQGKNVL